MNTITQDNENSPILRKPKKANKYAALNNFYDSPQDTYLVMSGQVFTATPRL